MARELLVFLLLGPTTAWASPEICGDGIDNDGVNGIDQPPFAWYLDSDGDGYGDPSTIAFTADCVAPANYVQDDGDCDDTDNNISPAETEDNNYDGVDQDCDYAIDDISPLPSNTQRGSDADSVFVGIDSTDKWTDIQSDCEAFGYEPLTPDDAAENDVVLTMLGPATPTQFWIGVHRPGPSKWVWYDGSNSPLLNWASGQPDGGPADDCAWMDAGGGSTAGEWFNDPCGDSRPYVCELDCATYDTFPDADGDGLGDAVTPTLACGPSPGQVLNNADCDDGDASVGRLMWYKDADGDGHGDPTDSKIQCNKPGGYVATPDDCDDTDDQLNDDTPWYADDDGDGFGAQTASSYGCTGGPGTLSDHSDCDDGDVAINPEATEVCDGVDDDCDDLIDADDPSVDAPDVTYYPDSDGDHYGSDLYPVTVKCGPPAGDYVDVGGDCDDTEPLVNPGAPEQCDNGRDDDCDNQIDEDSPDVPWYRDADGDGYGDPNQSQVACKVPGPGWVSDGTDCDDGDSDVHPGATDVPDDGIDQDCVGGDATTSTGSSGSTTTPPTTTGGATSGFDRGNLGEHDAVGCGCGTSGPTWGSSPSGLRYPPAAIALAALGLLVRRRR